MSQKKIEDTWVICPRCKTKLKQENLPTHLRYVHDKKIEDFDESSIKVLPKKGHKQKKSINLSIGTIAVILIILVIIVGVAFFVLSGSSDDSNNPGWLDDYTPVHSVGTGSDNFWINFTVGSTYAGQSVEHLTWITEDLEEKPVVFCVHRTGCQPCTPQSDRVKALGKIYGEDAVFYDLDLPLGGDIEKKAYESFYYDPNGGGSVIAFTGVFTLINDGREVKIGWHSWEGNVADAEMEDWIKDGIYYYYLNNGGIK